MGLEPGERFGRLAQRFVDDPAVTHGTGFGSNPGLRVGGRIFAMLVRDQLVVKVPRTRVDELVASGQGARFEPGTGKVMTEWASVPPGSSADWDALATEAFDFVVRSRR